MPTSTGSSLVTEKNKKTNRPLHLYTLHDYNGLGVDFLMAEYVENVTFDGLEYVAFPITFDSIKENNRGQIDAVTLRISNVLRVIQAYLEAEDFRGKKVTIRTVMYDLLEDSTAYVDAVYYIDSWASDQDDVSFTLTSKFNLLGVELPLRTYSRNYCSWTWKSTECGYSGDGEYCGRIKQGCKSLSNYDRFGGFPSLRPKRAILT